MYGDVDVQKVSPWFIMEHYRPSTTITNAHKLCQHRWLPHVFGEPHWETVESSWALKSREVLSKAEKRYCFEQIVAIAYGVIGVAMFGCLLFQSKQTAFRNNKELTYLSQTVQRSLVQEQEKPALPRECWVISPFLFQAAPCQKYQDAHKVFFPKLFTSAQHEWKIRMLRHNDCRLLNMRQAIHKNRIARQPQNCIELQNWTKFQL